MSQKELHIYLKDKKPSHFYEFMQAGGILKIAISAVTHIQHEIEQQRPMIALLTTHFLESTTPTFNFHFNVIVGIDKQHIIVHDPLHKSGNTSYARSEFMYALYASAHGDTDNASLLKIKRKL
ncbi:MAG: C39 family peptidase [Candidatus Woesearchaeota archaeon]